MLPFLQPGSPNQLTASSIFESSLSSSSSWNCFFLSVCMSETLYPASKNDPSLSHATLQLVVAAAASVEATRQLLSRGKREVTANSLHTGCDIRVIRDKLKSLHKETDFFHLQYGLLQGCVIYVKQSINLGKRPKLKYSIKDLFYKG